MRLHCSINVCFKLLTTGWKFGYRRSKFRPRPRIPGQPSIPHVGFCPAYVPAFPGLGESGRREAGIYFDWCIMKSQAFVPDSRVFQREHTSIRVQTSVFVIKSRVFYGAFAVFVMNPQVFKCKLPQFVINKYPVLVDVYLVNKPKFYSLVNEYLVINSKFHSCPRSFASRPTVHFRKIF